MHTMLYGHHSGPQLPEPGSIEWALGRAKYWWFECCKAYGLVPENLLYKTPPKVIISNRMVTTGGRAADNGTKNWVKLSYHFLRKEGAAYDQTIGHEVAHVFASRHYGRSCKHGPEWRRTMIAIGLPPKRCHNYESTVRRRNTPQGRYEYTCGCGIVMRLSQNLITRMSKGRGRVCRSCRRPVVLPKGT